MLESRCIEIYLSVVKVRNLESRNRQLTGELDKLTSKWGKETSQIKAMYHAELDDARRALDEAEKEKARLEIRVSSIEQLIEELQAKSVFFPYNYLQKSVVRFISVISFLCPRSVLNNHLLLDL